MKAFTLLELLVSTSILIILAGFVLFSQNRAPQTYDLLNAAQRLETEFRKVQGFALATKEFPTTIPSPPLGGWGIHLAMNANCYIIFGDKNNNGTFDPGPTELANPCDASKNDSANASERFERIFLPNTVTISALSPGQIMDIVYQAPLLSMLVNGFASSGSYSVIVSNKVASRSVTINAVGNIIAR